MRIKVAFDNRSNMSRSEKTKVIEAYVDLHTIRKSREELTSLEREQINEVLENMENGFNEIDELRSTCKQKELSSQEGAVYKKLAKQLDAVKEIIEKYTDEQSNNYQ